MSKVAVLVSVFVSVLLYPSLSLAMDEKHPDPNDRPIYKAGMSQQIPPLLTEGKGALLVFFGGGDLNQVLNERAIRQVQDSKASILIFDIDVEAMKKSKRMFEKTNSIAAFNVDLCGGDEVLEKSIDAGPSVKIPLPEKCENISGENLQKFTRFVRDNEPKHVHLLNFMLVSQLPVYFARNPRTPLIYTGLDEQGRLLQRYLTDRHFQRLVPIIQAIANGANQDADFDFVLIDTPRRSPHLAECDGRNAPLVPDTVLQMMNLSAIGGQATNWEFESQVELADDLASHKIRASREVVWAPLAKERSAADVVGLLGRMRPSLKEEQFKFHQKLGYWFCNRPLRWPDSIVMMKDKKLQVKAYHSNEEALAFARTVSPEIADSLSKFLTNIGAAAKSGRQRR